jgi:hypothetical protein
MDISNPVDGWRPTAGGQNEAQGFLKVWSDVLASLLWLLLSTVDWQTGNGA